MNIIRFAIEPQSQQRTELGDRDGYGDERRYSDAQARDAPRVPDWALDEDADSNVPCFFVRVHLASLFAMRVAKAGTR